MARRVAWILIAAACTSGDPSPPNEDAGTPPTNDAGRSDGGLTRARCDRLSYDEALLEQSTINGAAIVFVFGEDGLPIEGTTIVLVAPNAATFTAITTDTGCASFADPAIAHPIGVHAFAPGYAASSHLAFDQSVDRFTLHHLGDPPPPRSTTTISGGAPGLADLLPPDGQSATYARVHQLRPDALFSEPVQNQNEMIAPNDTSYELVADTNTTFGLYAIAGRALNDQRTPTHLALRTEIIPTRGEALEDIDFDFTIPFDTNVTYALENIPADSDVAGVRRQLFLPNGAAIELDANYNYPWPATFKSPAMAGATYGGIAVAHDTLMTRTSALIRRDGTTFSNWLTEPSALELDGRTIAFAPLPMGATRCTLEIADGTELLWRVDAATIGPFALPIVPETYDDPLIGSRSIATRCYRMQTTIDAYFERFFRVDF